MNDRPPLWTSLHDRLHRTLRKRQLLNPRQRLLVAVSGGQDSLALAKLLLDLCPLWDWELAIAHCNHRWRDDSDANAKAVSMLAADWQLPYFEAIAEHSIATEAAARQWRYDALGKLAATQNYTAVLIGHTASDRAETLLYNLIRGSGTDGLTALVWTRELMQGVQIVRPLLEVRRSETAAFCQAAKLPVWQDSTNSDRRYARNRIRQDVLPYLQTHLNPEVEQNLAQTAELLRADVDCLEALATELRLKASGSKGQNLERNQLDRTVLKSAPLALQRRVMRQILQQHIPTAPSFEHIEKLTALIDAPNRTRTDPFPGGAIAEVDGNWIRLS